MIKKKKLSQLNGVSRLILIAVLIMSFGVQTANAELTTYGGVVYEIPEYSDKAFVVEYDGVSDVVKIMDNIPYQGSFYRVSFGEDKKEIFKNQNSIRTVDASAAQRLDPGISFSGCQFLSTVIPSKEWEEIGEYQYFDCQMLDLGTVLTPTVRGVGDYAFAMENPSYMGELHGVDISAISNSTCMHNRIYSVIDLKATLVDGQPQNCIYSEINKLDLSQTTCIMLDGYYGFNFEEVETPKLMTLCISNGDLYMSSAMPSTLESVILGGKISLFNEHNEDNRNYRLDIENVEVIEMFSYGFYPHESLNLQGKVRNLILSSRYLKTLTGCEGITSADISGCRLLESISLPDIEVFPGITSCANLKEIYLGESLKEVDSDYTFDECKNLTDLIFGGTIEQWIAVKKKHSETEHPTYSMLASIENFWYGHGNAKTTKLTELNSDNIGNTTEIGTMAFAAYAGLTKIDLPATVKVIGSTAFAYCSNLKDVKINAERIEQYAFYGDEAIENFTIGNELAYIGPAFSEYKYSDPITTVNYLGDADSWSKITRTNVAYIDPYNYETGVISQHYGTFVVPAKEMLFNGSPLYTLVLENPTNIAPAAFANIKSLTNVKITCESVYPEFGEKSFYGCSNLKSFEIVSNIVTRTSNDNASGFVIGNEAFAYCSALEEIPMLSNLKSIASDALVETGWIKKQPLNTLIYLDTELGRTAFAYNGTPAENSSLVIDEGTEAINDGAFASYAMAGFTALSLPQTLKYIGQDSFSGTQISGDLVIPAAVETMKSNSFSDINCLKFEDSDMPIELGYSSFSSIKSIYIGRNFTETSREIHLLPPGTSLKKVEYGEKVTEVNYINGIPFWADDVECIYSYSKTPPACQLSEDGYPIGLGVDKETCILYVPSGSVDTYRAADGWGMFKDIRPFDPAAIESVIGESNSISKHYDITGCPIESETKGIHIVVGKDGKARKVLVR